MGGKSAISSLGQRFGRLVVTMVNAGPGFHSQVFADCDCGGKWVGTITPLRSGSTKSCGCLSPETTTKRNTTHGMSRTPEYKVWKGMRRRCNEPSNDDYYLYGARGIRVCERWESFENFIADMGPRPSSSHSIDREDSDGNYEPTNCRWATPIEQGRNTSRVVRYEYRGDYMTVREFSEKYNLPIYAFKSRLQTGWSIERAIETPYVKSKAGELLTAHGMSMTLSQWAQHLGMRVGTLHMRIRAGWPIEQALSSIKLK